MNRSLWMLKETYSSFPISPFMGIAKRVEGPVSVDSAPAEVASDLFHQFVEAVRQVYDRVETGIFQADMAVDIINDGPVTLLLDSDKQF